MLRVLLVEDDDATRTMYRLKFELEGFDVLEAGDGRGGIHLMTSGRPDLAFLDINLPDIDGIAVLRAIRARPATAELPVVILTNLDDGDLRATALDLGIRDWIVKSETLPGVIAEKIPAWVFGAK